MVQIYATHHDILYMLSRVSDCMLSGDIHDVAQCPLSLYPERPSNGHSISMVRTPHASDTLVDTRYGLVDPLDLLSAGVS